MEQLYHRFLVTLKLLYTSKELNRVLGNLWENLEHVLFLGKSGGNTMINLMFNVSCLMFNFMFNPY